MGLAYYRLGNLITNLIGSENMNLDMILQIALPVLTIFLGALSAYFAQNEKLRNSAVKYIAEAEEIYKYATKSGGSKFAFVVDTLYKLVPAPLKIVITRDLIEEIVQSTFDNIQEYAKIQMDKAVNNYIENKDVEK